jgi:hypothetical protein
MELTNKAAKSSIDAVIEEYKKHVDRTLIRQNLRLTVQQRFEKAELELIRQEKNKT